MTGAILIPSGRVPQTANSFGGIVSEAECYSTAEKPAKIAFMKALILAGGTGSRLRPITHSIAKQLVPVANKAVIEFGIEAIRETGITDFGIIVGDAHSEIERHLGDGSRWGCKFCYIPQSSPLGLPTP